MKIFHLTNNKRVEIIETLNSLKFMVFTFFFFISGTIILNIQTIMDNVVEVVKTIDIGLVVAAYLRTTGRNLQALEFCKECLILLNNIALGVEDQFAKLCYRDVYVVMFNAYFSISDYTNAERHARKLLPMFRDSGDKRQEGRLNLCLAKIYHGQSRFVEAKELCERAIKIMKAIGERGKEAVAYGLLADIFWIA